MLQEKRDGAIIPWKEGVSCRRVQLTGKVRQARIEAAVTMIQSSIGSSSYRREANARKEERSSEQS